MPPAAWGTTVEPNVSVKSKLQLPPPPRATPRAFDFFEIIVQISSYLGQNAVQMPLTRVHSGDQMPLPRGHFTGTKMTEGNRNAFSCRTKSL